MLSRWHRRLGWFVLVHAHALFLSHLQESAVDSVVVKPCGVSVGRSQVQAVCVLLCCGAHLPGLHTSLPPALCLAVWHTWNASWYQLRIQMTQNIIS